MQVFWLVSSHVIEVVFCGYVIGNDGNGEVNAFILVQGCTKVVIFNVEGDESCIGAGNSGVEE